MQTDILASNKNNYISSTTENTDCSVYNINANINNNNNNDSSVNLNIDFFSYFSY